MTAGRSRDRTTATLTINPVAFTDAGVYDVVVTDSCTNATSNGATLSVEFDDVASTNPFHDDIITLATSGITGGCTATSYCPGNPVSRAEMAVFLLKAKFGADHVPPPPPPDPIFPDVPARRLRRGVDRRARDAGHHRRLRRSQRRLLPGRSGHPRPDGGLPLEDAQRLRLRAASPGRHLLRRAAGLLRDRLDRGHLQPRHHGGLPRRSVDATAPTRPSRASRWRRSS